MKDKSILLRGALTALVASGFAAGATVALADNHDREQCAGVIKAGKNEEAVFVFYLGQLRYRTFLLANPKTEDPTLFATLSQGGLAIHALVPKQIMDILQGIVIIAVAVTVPEVRRAMAARGAAR